MVEIAKELNTVTLARSQAKIKGQIIQKME